MPRVRRCPGVRRSSVEVSRPRRSRGPPGLPNVSRCRPASPIRHSSFVIHSSLGISSFVIIFRVRRCPGVRRVSRPRRSRGPPGLPNVSRCRPRPPFVIRASSFIRHWVFRHSSLSSASPSPAFGPQVSRPRRSRGPPGLPNVSRCRPASPIRHSSFVIRSSLGISSFVIICPPFVFELVIHLLFVILFIPCRTTPSAAPPKP